VQLVGRVGAGCRFLVPIRMSCQVAELESMVLMRCLEVRVN
jgi:hypothetical protein